MQKFPWLQKIKSILPPQWWSQNRSSIKTLFVLMLGLMILQIASLYIFSFYIIGSTFQVNRQQFSESFVRTVRLSKALPPDQVPRFLGGLHGRGTTVQIADQPAPNSEIVYYNLPKDLIKFADKNYNKLLASVPLSNGKWLIVRGNVQEHPWFLLGFIAAYFVIFLMVFLFCAWAIRRVALPAHDFIQAAKRFGVDVQSPPMALQGSSEIQELILAFNQMQDRIRRLLNDRTQMLAAISHDLRTPITRLQLRAETYKDTSQYEKMIADLNEMDRMIASILSFARDYVATEAAERIDLNALLETLCHDLSDMGHSIKYQSHEKRVPFWGRLLALKRAFSNLIENAVKYGERAEVILTQTESRVQIKISDEGPGIPEDELEHVFAPFYRVDRSRSPKVSGSGLGLAVARDIIRAHGGDIRLMNQASKGLVVVITLPYTHS